MRAGHVKKEEGAKASRHQGTKAPRHQGTQACRYGLLSPRGHAGFPCKRNGPEGDPNRDARRLGTSKVRVDPSPCSDRVGPVQRHLALPPC